MRVKVPYSVFVLFIGLFNLMMLMLWLFDGEPNEPIRVLILIAAIGALIFIPLGIKYIKEDYNL